MPGLLDLFMVIIYYFNYYKIEPNNQKLLKLRERALEEQKKLQESHEEKVKERKQSNPIVL